MRNTIDCCICDNKKEPVKNKHQKILTYVLHKALLQQNISANDAHNAGNTATDRKHKALNPYSFQPHLIHTSTATPLKS
jgi:hypothetical protein